MIEATTPYWAEIGRAKTFLAPLYLLSLAASNGELDRCNDMPTDRAPHLTGIAPLLVPERAGWDG